MWIVKIEGKPHELIIDFDNDRHHAMKIEIGSNRNEFADNLKMLADNLEEDTHLDDHGEH